MATVFFTSHLARHLTVNELVVRADDVAQALAAAFVQQPLLRGYILDDSGAVRHHVAVFVDGLALQDRIGLSDPVGESSEVYVMQALSGG